MLTLGFGWPLLVEIVGPQELLRVRFSVVVNEKGLVVKVLLGLVLLGSF